MPIPSAHPLPASAPTGYAGLIGRITHLEEALLELKRFGEALQESEKRYRRLFESAKDGILILDAETGKVVDVNPFLLDLLGLSFDAAYGQYIWELGVFKDIAASKDAFRTLQFNEYIRYEDLPLETLHGKAIAVEFVSNVYLVDNAKVIQCNIRDITARKRADAERKRLMAAIEQVGEAIVITDAQGLIQFVNPAFEQVTGYKREEAIGQNPRLLKSGKHDEGFYRDLWATIAGGTTWSGRLVNRRKNGTLFTEEATISPVRDPTARIINYVAVKRDITEHLRLANQVQQAQKLEAIGLLASGVAHDYNNMLSVILGNTELAMKRLGSGHPLQVYLEQVHEAAVRSTDITRQLLAYSRRQPINPLVLDLNLSVERMLEMLRRLLGEAIDLEWVPEAGQCKIRMDPVQVHQIVANLCINARDAIAKGGKITINTGTAVFDEVSCAAHPGCLPGEYVLLEFTDNGSGMDQEVIDHLFEPFFSTKEMGRGTGLGLATVYGIVQQNNGFIDVRSEPGKGTAFRLFLPRCTGAPVDPQLERREKLPLSHGENVLVVEDEPAILTIAKMMLEELGYRVFTAATPQEALVMLKDRTTPIHLLIADLVMPGMSGKDLAERLKIWFPDLKALLMSGYSIQAIAPADLVIAGANFLQKPFSLMDLASKVRETLKAE